MRMVLCLILCIGLLAISSTAIAEQDCLKKCQSLGDHYYNECLQSVSNGKRPSGLIELNKFEPPEKGYPTQKYCYDYAISETDHCFSNCSDEFSFDGMFKPSYQRNDIVDPKVKAAQEAENAKDVDCVIRSGPMMDFCYDNFPEGDKRETCLEKVLQWQRKCMYEQ